MTTKLIYIGNGTAIIGVPARDLTEQDIATLEASDDFVLKEAVWMQGKTAVEMLLESGLYKKPETEPTPKKSKGAKESE